MKKLLVFVVGPTAIGKTSTAIDLATHFSTEIISCDSRQFYKEMNIGTAKPSPNEIKKIKHHLVGNISVKNNYNISEFINDSDVILKSILDEKGIAILVGGSGLYIESLIFGIDQVPEVNIDLRNKLNNDLKNNGIKFMQDWLRKLDPEVLDKIDTKNPRRVIRALEICITSKKKYSQIINKTKKKPKYDFLCIGLDCNRKELYEIINKRVDNMILNGLVDEVKSLYKFRESNALNTIGYKEIFEYLEGKDSLENCIEKIKVNSRRYAKRQLTWFRSKSYVKWFKKPKVEEIVNYIEINQQLT
ncbi:MAG: tRNA (adenosine(37)-N6)-dimethylallyltransferase MiaA [Flavobacteriaceae bacterium]|tara:strand:- start:2216 stop:3124 length:909 start_codon:yes stop_codon:yes gene_type:complete